MKKSQSALDEKGFAGILDIVRELNACRSRSDLAETVKRRIASVLSSRWFYFAHLVDSGESERIDVAGMGGVPVLAATAVERYATLSPLLHQLLEMNQPWVSVNSGKWSGDFAKELEGFISVLSAMGDVDGRNFFDKPAWAVAVWGGADLPLAVEFHGDAKNPLTPQQKTWLELIAPSLLGALDRLMNRELLREFRAYAEISAGASEALALVGPDLRVLYCNRGFASLLKAVEGRPAPEKIRREITRLSSSAKKSAGETPDSVEQDVPFFSLPAGTFRLVLRSLTRAGEKGKRGWIVRLQPADDPYHKMQQLMDKWDLTWKEMEICCLVHDGLDKYEAGERLGISPHTVRTHLKRIHRKLGVRSRTQLVALLNQLAGNAPSPDAGN